MAQKRSTMNKLIKFSKTIIAIAMMIAVCLPSLAHDFEIDGIYYNILSETDKTVEVTYKGSHSASYVDDYSGYVTIPSSILYNTYSYTVTHIGDEAFAYSRQLTSVSIPKSISTIGIKAFSSCEHLTSIYIPNSIVSIGSSAFSSCPCLTEITIPNSVTSIGESAFSGCSGLTSIIVENGNNKYDSRDNCNAIIETISNTLISGCKSTIIPNSVTTIGKGAFSGCRGLTEITIPNSVTAIGEYAFSSCEGLTSVSIPNSVTTLEYRVFFYCSSLTTITLGNSITKIGEDAFNNCTCLKSVIIPNSTTDIGKNAFYDCSSMTYISMGNSIRYIGEHAFGNCTKLSDVNISDLSAWCEITFDDSRANPLHLGGTLKLNGIQISNLIIPNNIKEIKDFAFYNCKGVNSAIIGNSVTTIGYYSFYKCTDLTSMTIPNSVDSIKEAALRECNINILHLPKSVEYVGPINNYADVCYCHNPTPPLGGGRTSNRLFVPKGSMMAYATAEGWKEAEQIMEFEVEDTTKPTLSIAYPEGGVLKQKVDNGESIEFQIVPANNWKCHSITFNGVDVTTQLDATGRYTTPSITSDSQLSIVFIKNDGGVANTINDNNINVKASGNVISIVGADDFSDVKIYNTAGNMIYNGYEKTIALDGNGVYILTVEGRTFKFAM